MRARALHCYGLRAVAMGLALLWALNGHTGFESMDFELVALELRAARGEDCGRGGAESGRFDVENRPFADSSTAIRES